MYSDPVKTCARISVINKFLLFKKKKTSDVEPAENKVKKIHEQLQGFGQVGAVNVSYWFQNRNSRSKQKKRILYNKKLKTQQNSTPCNSLPQILTPPPNSFSSDHQKASIGFSNINDVMVLLHVSPAGL